MRDDDDSMDNNSRRDALDPCKPGRVSGNKFGATGRPLNVPDYIHTHSEPVGRPRNGDRDRD